LSAVLQDITARERITGAITHFHFIAFTPFEFLVFYFEGIQASKASPPL